MIFTVAEENYIKAIYHLQQTTGKVSTNELAEKMQTKPASITDMLKKLTAKKLLLYQKYKGFKLSAEGKKIAVDIIRKHRLWEYFLVNELGLGWDEVHEIAEELEHISSKKLIDELDRYLEFPKYDPHGDPIPDKNGKMETRVAQVALLELPLHQLAQVTAVTNQSTELLEILNHKKISIGTKLEVKKRFSFDQSLEIKINQNAPITISNLLAQALMVKPV